MNEKNHIEKVCQKCGADHRMYDVPPLCDKCYEAHQLERFEAMPVVKWDGKAALVVHNSDTYFFDEDTAADYVFENPDARICICDPVYLHEVDPSDWADDMGEDGDLPDEVTEAIGVLNRAIVEANKQPSCWIEGNERIDNAVEFPQPSTPVEIPDRPF